MTLLSPGHLWLLGGVAVVGAAYVALQHRRRHYAARFTNLELLAVVAPKRPGWRRHVSALIMLGALSTLVVGFARPARAEKVPRQEATVVLAIDTSASMDAADVPPTRLVAAQRAATSFAHQIPPRFRLGLISFDGVARVLVPPTTDHLEVANAISKLQLGPRTAAGEAVYAALDTIAATTAKKNITAARIVLMSDGATTTGRPLDEAGAAARQAGVPVSAIAYGTDGGTVTIGDRVIPVPVDREAMSQLARASGGKFFEAATGKELASIYRDIGSTFGFTIKRHEITATFTLLALALATAGLLTGLLWTGRVI